MWTNIAENLLIERQCSLTRENYVLLQSQLLTLWKFLNSTNDRVFQEREIFLFVRLDWNIKNWNLECHTDIGVQWPFDAFCGHNSVAFLFCFQRFVHQSTEDDRRICRNTSPSLWNSVKVLSFSLNSWLACCYQNPLKT